MPIYEYVCRDCGREFEELVRGSEIPLCPACGRADAQRLVSVPAAPIVSGNSLPVAGTCPPANAPPCGPGCCRLPS